MQNKPLPNTHGRHYKSSGWVDRTYEVIGIARHSETHEDMVVYPPLYIPEENDWMKWYEFAVRPLLMWDAIVEYNWVQIQIHLDWLETVYKLFFCNFKYNWGIPFICNYE